MARYLVTSALPYANGPIHFGHVAGAYLPADIFVRFRRLCGDEVLYICGTDEHGVAITLSAEQEGITPRQQVDRWHTAIARTFEALAIDFDHFGRTTDPIHYELSQWFFLQLLEHGWIAKRSERQYYDPSADRWLPDRYLVGTCPHCGHPEARGDECGRCGAWIDPLALTDVRSRITGQPAELRETWHWYLELDRVQPWLERWLGEKRASWKPNVINKLFSDQLEQGLRPRAITRDLEWGVPVPLDDPDARGKVLYVWFDAPIGYISATIEWARARFGAGADAERAWRSWWQSEDVRLVHFIGKDNIPFHCMTFPAMLHGVGERIRAGARFTPPGAPPVEERPYVLPADVPANEFYNLQGGKFSTSGGWYIDLDRFFERYSADAARWCIARSAPETADSEWTWEFFQQTTNRELADAFGNLASRALKFVHQRFDGLVPPLEDPDAAGLELLDALAEWPERVGRFLSGYRVKRAAVEVLELAHRANKYFNDQAPWRSIRDDRRAAGNALHVTLQVLGGLAVMLAPFVPSSARRLARQLGVELGPGVWRDAGRGPVPAGRPVGEPEILFAKVSEEQIQRELDELRRRAEERAASEDHEATMTEPHDGAGRDETAAPLEPIKPEIAFEDFLKLDIRTGRVVSVDEVPKSKKLLELRVDIGVEERTVLAGVKQDVDPAELVGRTVLILANLAPRRMAGRVSQGMMLAVSRPDGSAVLISPVGPTEPGWPVT